MGSSPVLTTPCAVKFLATRQRERRLLQPGKRQVPEALVDFDARDDVVSGGVRAVAAPPPQLLRGTPSEIDEVPPERDVEFFIFAAREQREGGNEQGEEKSVHCAS